MTCFLLGCTSCAFCWLLLRQTWVWGAIYPQQKSSIQPVSNSSLYSQSEFCANSCFSTMRKAIKLYVGVVGGYWLLIEYSSMKGRMRLRRTFRRFGMLLLLLLAYRYLLIVIIYRAVPVFKRKGKPWPIASWTLQGTCSWVFLILILNGLLSICMALN